MILNIPPEIKESEFVLVNGILNSPGDVKGWTDRAEYMLQNWGLLTTRFEYFSGAATRFFNQSKNVVNLHYVLKQIKRKIIFVGHSNGCELFSRIIRETSIQFQHAHLFAGACQSDFKKNGFNDGIRYGRIGKLFLYCSGNDHTLRDGYRATNWLSSIGLGYGKLGYEGPINMSDLAKQRTVVEWRNKYNHRTWLSSNRMLENSLKLTFRT